MTVTLRKPKYVNHLIREVFRLDSVAFLFKGGLPNVSDPLYIISDRFSPFAKGENPIAKVSIIPWKEETYQLRIAIKGNYHVEKLSYYVKDPKKWVEWAWIIFPQHEISRLRRFLASFIDENTGLWELI